MRPVPTTLTLVLAVSASLPAQKVVTENHPNGKPHFVYEVDQIGRKHGKLEQFADDGRLEQRMHFDAERLHGKYETFFENSKLHVSGTYHMDRKNGLWREFDASGNKVEFVTWRFEVKNGAYQSFHPGGAKKLVASYREDKLHGRHQQFSADGAWEREANYKEGVLTGKVTIKRDGKVISKQKWANGRIVDLDGIVPHPKAVDVLRAELAKILQPPKDRAGAQQKPPKVAKRQAAGQRDRGKPGVRPPKSVPGENGVPDPKAAERAAALRRLQAYRHLCGLRYADMALVPKWNDMCDAASEVCQANGGLSHHPPKPPGFDDARYELGRRGAGRSNLSGGSGMVRSVDSYMNDSDPSNIDRIGHRRWCLNPAMKLTGFGSSGRYSAMWSMDASGSRPSGLPAVLYPPPGYVPVDFFGPRHAWSISVMRGSPPKAGAAKVDVRPLDEYFQPVGEPMQLNHLGVAGGGYGTGKCLVFRPTGVAVRPGSRYLVRVSLDAGKSIAYRYVVEFCEAVGRGQR